MLQDQKLNKKELEWILYYAKLNDGENAQMLEEYGASYLEPTKDGEEPETALVIIEHFKALPESDNTTSWRVLRKLLENPVPETTLQKVSNAAHLNSGQKWSFLELCKPKPKDKLDKTSSDDIHFPDYVSLYPNATVLIDMFQNVEASNEEKKAYLDCWLDLEKGEPGKLSRVTVQKIIDAAHLDGPGKANVVETYGKDFITSHELRPVILKLFEDVLQAPNRSEYKNLYESLFEAAAGDKTKALTDEDREAMEQILKIADLKGTDRREFLQKYGESEAVFCCHSETVLGYYEELVSKGERLEFTSKSESNPTSDDKKDKVDILPAWIAVLINDPQADQNADLLKRIYISSLLDSDERANFLEAYGEDILSLYPNETDWLEIIRQYLLDFNFDRSPEEWELANEFLKFLVKQSQLPSPDVLRIARCWQPIVECFLLPESMLSVFFVNRDAENEFSKPGREISPSQIAYDSRLRASGKTLSRYISSVGVLQIICEGVKISFTPDSIIILLEAAAKRTGMVYQQKHDINILLPYIKYIPYLEDDFPEITLEKDEYTKKIWDELLQCADTETFKHLRRPIQDYSQEGHPKVLNAWSEYEREHKKRKGMSTGSHPALKKPTLEKLEHQKESTTPLEYPEQAEVTQKRDVTPPPGQSTHSELSTTEEPTQSLVSSIQPVETPSSEERPTVLVPESKGQAIEQSPAATSPEQKSEEVNVAKDSSPTDSYDQQRETGPQSVSPLSKPDVIRLVKQGLEKEPIERIVAIWTEHQQTLDEFSSMSFLGEKQWDLMKLICDFYVLSQKLEENREILQGNFDSDGTSQELELLSEYCINFIFINNIFRNKKREDISKSYLSLIQAAHNYIIKNENKQVLPKSDMQRKSHVSDAVGNTQGSSTLASVNMFRKNKQGNLLDAGLERLLFLWKYVVNKVKKQQNRKGE